MTAEPAGRAYTADEITVYFDSSRCRHFAECVRGAPSVFDVDKRPWIQPANGTADKIAEVVRRCPSGALHYRLAAGPAEVADVPTTVTVIPFPPDGAGEPPRPPPGSVQGSAKPFAICAGLGAAVNLHRSSSIVFTAAATNVTSTPCFTTSSLLSSISV